ncbi:MAG: dienelactone hydrolase family protein [Deltaproteobacteria bacterium]|nr:MAG: dienelactone hydrolase family protein [Deltaproteobacteria bacterium]TMQ20204.1 MAG: dienelactone hydrolase family protein [Deltaproteobacteria bacterium]
MRILSEVPDAAQAPGVVVMMHGPGLDRFLEDRVQELARHGYAAAAPDLYHRQPDDDVDTMTRAGRLRDDEIVADIDAVVAHLRGLARPRVTELAVLGFCMGGRNTYLAAGARPGLWRAAVVFYGGNIMKPWGGERAPFELTAQIACPVLGLFGLDDPNPSPADVDRIDGELTRHGKPHEFHRYAGAGHAFLNFSNPERYRPEQARQAWQLALDFLGRHLRRT